jgi:PAS domain S-box-containing protein
MNGRAKILVVEDEAIIAKDLKRRLENQGYDVSSVVPTGEDAIERAGKDAPDLVLMDIVLIGEIDGIEAAEQIRSRYDIPVIYVTAYADEKVLERAKLTEPFGYIIKPFEDRELRSAIEMALYKHHTERKLRESEEWLSTTLKSIGDAVIATDRNGLVTFMNPVAEELTGWQQQEAIGEPIEEIFHIINEKNRKRIDNPLDRVLQDGMTVHLDEDTVLIARDGGERIILDSVAPICDKEGKTSGVVLFFRDITEKKRLDDVIRQRNEFLNNILESLTHPFYVIDAEDYTIQMANSAANFGGLTEQSTCYKLTHGLDKPCDGKDHPCTLREVKKVGKAVVLEHTHYDRYGKSSVFRIYGYPIFDKNEKIVQIIEYTQDISEVKMLEDQFRHSQKMESVGRLAGGVAHDFNNLLSVILGYSELALMKLPEDHAVKQNINVIMDAGKKAEALINQLLAFSRKQVLRMRVVSINDIVENMMKILNLVIGEDVILDVNLSSTARNIKADPGQLEQVLMNLVVNARDAMPCGGRLSIETENVALDEEYAMLHEGMEAGSYVLLAVTDTGKGMSHDVQEKIFDPFYTTKETKGTGLGLSTVYGIVRQHKGNIFVYSEPDTGTTFKIYFPVSGEREEVITVIDKKTEVRGTETILVVDDEPSIRRLVVDTLLPLGYRILEASCGEEALQISKTTDSDIDLLLTDVIMPDMNGRELSEAIVADRPPIRIIFTSGYTNDVVVHYGIMETGRTFIQKPLTPKRLARKVREILDKDL